MKKLAVALPVALMLVVVSNRRSTSREETPEAPVRAPASAPTNAMVAKPSVAPTVASAAVSTPVPARAQAVERIMKLQKCFDSEDCPFTQEDPRAYNFAVGRALAKELNEFRGHYAADASAQLDYEFVARTFIQSLDGYVGAEALAMLKGMPVSAENLEALTIGLKGSPDPKLVAQALPELQRYLGTPWEQEVHKFLSETIETGAHFTSRTVSQSMLPFINAASFEEYRSTLSHLRPHTQVAKDLAAALEEYERLQTGA